MEFSAVSWPAVVLGTVLAYGLGWLWFSPKMFGSAWSKGSHDIRPPDKPPVPAIVTTFIGIFVLSVVVGMVGSSITAVLVILATASLIAGMDLFSQKTNEAALIDAGYILASGALMLLSHAVL